MIGEYLVVVNKEAEGLLDLGCTWHDVSLQSLHNTPQIMHSISSAAGRLPVLLQHGVHPRLMNCTTTTKPLHLCIASKLVDHANDLWI